MYFLIDFENVANNGMRGSEHLLSSDYILIFYSSAAPQMETRHLNNIRNSGCGFATYKLKEKRKNGLDFYIATKIGELFGAEKCSRAVIISKDAGFQSVRDFWAECSGTKHRVLLGESIEQGILSAGENNERTQMIRTDRKTADIGQFFAAYEEEVKIRKKLEELFGETPFANRLPEIQQILHQSNSKKIIYLDSLRHFGRKDGQEIYRTLKDLAEI